MSECFPKPYGHFGINVKVNWIYIAMKQRPILKEQQAFIDL